MKTLTVQAASTGATIDYAAEIRARSESRLGFRVGGKLVRRAVDVGDAVRAGQLLASLDPQDLRLSQEAAHSALEAARINADQAAADFKRFKELREQGFISLAELERRESAYKAAQAQFEQARAQAGVQSNQTRYSNLVSDVAGVVTVVEAEPGAVLAAGATVLRLAHEGPRDAVFSVPEQQVAAIRALLGRNGALKMRLWGDAAASIPATVREVAAAADPATRTFTVKADVGRAAVRLGQTATVSLPVPPSSGAFRLPLTAVFEQQGQAAVWLLDPASMTVQPQRIEVIGAEGNAVLVASGLTAGQTVVTAGAHTLTPGQKVTLYLEPGSAATAGPASTVQR
ncbi:MAG: efflux RND transporter periplasmic adaptor subunit [Aquincola sp.]|nr:efflux RND transporter periplasmic adaptor subunit [Aquincola sp.]MDH5331149.1 efflux RND transporter periplasmic adaptor subunit [Aquincola sp.]